MKKKQTAVEWLVEEINKNGEEIHKNGNWIPTHMIEQAKQMEKEQIEMACDQQEFEDIDGLGICETISKGQLYYNETYGETKN